MLVLVMCYNCPYKYVVLTGSCTTKNSEFDYHMNDDLGRMWYLIKTYTKQLF
jgi:hypothetical protein